jgi:hypothetical protein
MDYNLQLERPIGAHNDALWNPGQKTLRRMAARSGVADPTPTCADPEHSEAAGPRGKFEVNDRPPLRESRPEQWAIQSVGAVADEDLRSAQRATGLLPFNPQAVLERVPDRPATGAGRQSR